jgi:class 3 adenylate cyclase/tetratricopeptide (TPR) repeat protein
MPLRCVSCLTANPDSNRYCGNCGSLLSAQGEHQSPQLARPVTEFQWGSLKHATILFADVVNSTEHVAGLDPEQAMEQLHPAVQRMCHAVERFGGTVVRTLGDGILALFGVPKALEGHASLACEAAIAMQAAFEGHAQGIRIRVGLHCGQVALDPEAADAMKGGGVHGHAIHLASRVVALAEPGGICLTADCLALVRTVCDVRLMGQHVLKGIAEPVEIHALLGMKHDALHHFHEATLSVFRGRVRELDVLKNALARAGQGQGAVVGLSGAPGTGKSRLCHEFAEWCRARRIPVFEVRTQLYGHATPLQPVLMLLRTCFFQITPTDEAASVRERIAEVLAKSGTGSADDLSLLCEFLGVAEAGSPPCPLNPKARRARLLGLVHELVKHVGAAPCVIVFEDLHWLDEASAEFVSAMVQAVAGTQILLLLNYRPGYEAPWSQLLHFQSMHLADLGLADTEALVRDRLRLHPQLAGIFAFIVERSAGNPFFAEELVNSLIEKSAQLKAPAGTPPDMAAVVHTLPATVQAVIGERIDRLVASQRTLLHICAVIGKEIPLLVLQDVAVYLVSQLESGLDGLCEVELLQLLREIAGGRRFAFRHPLIQEVAYSTQLKARRANLHAAVAVAMEAHYSAQPGEFAALIAYHYAAAGQFFQAAEHEARAARWTGSTNSAQAMKHWRRVWTLLEGQKRSREVNSLRALAGGRIVYLGWREGLRPEEVQKITQEALGLASAVDSRLVQLLLLAQGRILQSGGGPADDYVNCILKALALSQSGQDAGRVAMLNVALSQAYAWSGLLREGLAANDAALLAVELIDQFDREFIDFSIEQWVLGIRVRLLIRMNRLQEAKTCLQQMLSTDQNLSDPVIRQITHHLHVEFAAVTQDVPLAHEHVSIVANLAQQYASPYSKIFALWCSGMAATGGDLQAALERFSEALAFIDSTKAAVEFEAEIRASLAECHYQLGNFDLAVTAARENIEIARPRSNRLAECRALIVWASALGQKEDAGSWASAISLFEQAEQLIGLTGAEIYTPALTVQRSRVAQLMAAG